MNIEKTQKKEYVAPEIEEVELFCRGNLLQDASLECDAFDSECMQ
jgi:hypothetical protein